MRTMFRGSDDLIAILRSTLLRGLCLFPTFFPETSKQAASRDHNSIHSVAGRRGKGRAGRARGDKEGRDEAEQADDD